MAIHVSRFPDVDPVDIPIHDYVLEHADEHADVPAMVDTASGTALTHGQLAVLIRRFAAGVQELGLVKGDVLALHSPNTIYYPVILFGTTMAGGTVTTLSPLATAEDIAGQLLDSGARYYVTVSILAPVADAAVALVAERTGTAIEVFTIDETPGHRSAMALLSDTELTPVAIDPAIDVAVLPYSSGTTGVPKGVMLTHRNLATNLLQVETMHRVGPGDRAIAILPFFHIYGMAVLVNGVLRHGTTAYVHAKFDLDAFLTSLTRDRITHAYVAPPVMVALAKHPAVDGLDLSHLRVIICAAAPLDGALQEAVAARLGVEIGQAYGMTELSPGTHIHTDGAVEPPACVGQLFPSTQARLVDLATFEDVDPGQPGELWIRGPQMMKGYFGRPGDTDATIDADGWLHTGDIATVDDDGNWFIVDRVKELIKYKGYQVAPAELEAMLLADPEILDAAVIGVLDEDGQEIPKAFVVPAPGSGLTEQVVMDRVAASAAPHKRVRRVEFVEAIPKAASGKILRRELRARERGER